MLAARPTLVVVTAGYSGTPLAAKLGITTGQVLAVLDDPGGFLDLCAPLPDGVEVKRTARGRADVAVAFVPGRAALRRRLGSVGRLVFPAGAVWVCWPKRASGVATDLTEDVVRGTVLTSGLVDVEVAAIDATWSGLKFVWRRELRKPS